MTYLLAGGCSFTDDNYKAQGHDCSYPKWPTILAKKFNISKTVNTAKSSGSNELMFGSVTDNIITSKPKVVALLMTSWDRVTPYGWPVNPFEVAELLVQKQLATEESEINRINSLLEHCKEEWLLSEYVIKTHMDIGEIVNSNLRMLYTLQEMCKELSINLIVAQAFEPIRYFAIERLRDIKVSPYDPGIRFKSMFARAVLKSSYFDKIDWNKISIGGPFFDELGGKDMNGLIWEQSDIDLSIRESQLWLPNDGHPAAKGHEAIAQIFYNEYKKKYL